MRSLLKQRRVVRLLALLWGAVFLTLVAGGLNSSYAWADEGSEGLSGDNQVYVNQLPDSSFLYETSIADLAQADSFYEGQVVLVQGEVVGDCINDESQSNYCWITLQDTNADNPAVVAVVMTKEQASIIDTYGAYQKTGTILQVRGIFHLQCSAHQGMSDIHVSEVSAVAPGSVIEHSFDERLFIAAVAAIVIGPACVGLYHLRRERMR